MENKSLSWYNMDTVPVPQVLYYSYYNPSDKSLIRKRSDSDYVKQNSSGSAFRSDHQNFTQKQKISHGHVFDRLKLVI